MGWKRDRWAFEIGFSSDTKGPLGLLGQKPNIHPWHKSAHNVLKSLRKREQGFFHWYGEQIMRLREGEGELIWKEY